MNLNETLQQAIACQQAGQNAEAEHLYRSILQAQPNHPDANHNLGLLLAGADGLGYLKAALEADPTRGQFWLSYADALLASGQAKEALLVMQTAMQCGLDSPVARTLLQEAEIAALGARSMDVQEKPDAIPEPELPKVEKPTVINGASAQKGSGAAKLVCPQKSLSQAEINQLVALFNAGRYLELEERTRLLIRQYPNAGFLWKALGTSLQMQGKDALPVLQKAAELLPDDAEMHNNLGNALRDMGRFDEAVASFRRALKIRPDSAEMHSNMGNALRDMGQHASAVASFRRALGLKPDFVEAYNNLGNVQRDLGQFEGAVESFRRALELKPDFAEAYNNLGNTLRDIRQFEGAVDSFRRALELKPDFVEAYSNLGNAQRDMGQLAGAMDSYRRALEIKPDHYQAHNNMGNTLMHQGQLDAAQASFRQALQIKPDFLEACSNLLFCLTRNEQADARALFAEHLYFGEQFEAPHRAGWQQHNNSRDPGRCLQIGFVSGDLFDHAVASFIEPVLAHLAGYAQLSLHAYYNNTLDDHVTQRMRGHFAHWHAIAGLSDTALADKIRADGIDILIDLSGHTANTRLLTFARKPAPVQASWIGYPGTTGLRAMDYYLADRFLLPQGEFDDQFTEKIVRLPANAPFLPAVGAPPVNALPALGNGYVTFGSFNHLSKISPVVVALWSQLLRALPDSKMLLGAMPAEGEYDELIDWFAQEGIARDRLSFRGRSGLDVYLGMHQQVDICLDTFPYNGGTTTLHALWMGVPTLTLAGSTMPGRVGAAVLGHVGLDDFVARDKSDFVAKGLYWAGHLSLLAEVRAGLRERFAQSSMSQPAVIAAGLARALRIMWQRWCAGLPAESFEVTREEVDAATLEAGK